MLAWHTCASTRGCGLGVCAMSDSPPAGIGPHIQSIVDILAQSLDRAVLLDDESLAPITHSRQFGQLDDVRMYSLLQRGIFPRSRPSSSRWESARPRRRSG